MALGVRELAVLLCCAALALLALQQEGELQVQPVWFQPIEHSIDAVHDGHAHGRGASDVQIMSSYANGQAPRENELGPAPLVTDLDGDGQNEVVLVTREPKLKIFKFKGGGAQNQNFHTLYSHRGIDWDQLQLVREVGLLSSVSVTSGRQIVGLSSGYLRPYSRTRNRKQVLVLVNEGWGIFVFNHKLRLLWTRAIETDLSLRYLAEVAIVVDPHPMRKAGREPGARNDTGVVIVGGRLALKSGLHAGTIGVHEEPAGMGEGQAGPRPLEFPADYQETLQGRILRPGSTRGSVTSDDLPDTEESHSETLSRDPLHFEHAQHFSYYAFEGLTGDTRWRHDSSSFIEETDGSDLLRPQHESLHSGEMDWRVFRQALLEDALPHAWEGGRSATRMEIAHVEKTRSGAQRQAQLQAHQVKSNFFVRDSPLGLRPHSDSEHVANPNALIVHLRDGIELLHLYSGRPLCRLTLRAGEVHVDMNGDGVIDHLEAVGGIHRAGNAARSGEQEHHAMSLPKCLAMVRSGIPPSRQLFNASICQSSWADMLKFGSLFGNGAGAAGSRMQGGGARSAGRGGRGSRRTGRGGRSFSLESEEEDLPSSGGTGQTGSEQSQAALAVAHPIVVQEPHTVGKAAKRRRYHSFFFLNSGLISSFNHDGTRTWHTQTRATWLHSSGATGTAQSPALAAFRPTLTPFAARVDTPSEHVLVIGERYGALVSLGGSVRVEWPLAPDLAVAKPVVGDFNGDGLNDVVLVTTKGFYGYAVTRRLGGQLFSVLVICLLFLLLAVLAFKLSQADSFGLAAVKKRAIAAGALPQRGRTTFTSALRPMKSAKAQL